MRLPSFVAPLVALALLLGAATTSAQYPLPEGESYVGSLRVKTTCVAEGTGKLKVKGPVLIEDQVGGLFLASAELVGRSKGLDCTVDLSMLCTIGPFGAFEGSYETTVECTDGVETTTTSGSGEVTGRYVPGRLTFALLGQDDGGGRDVCEVQALFKGKGSPGTALCASLYEKAITKLGKKYFKAYSQRILTANVAESIGVLQAAVAKAEAAFAKAGEKVAKKVGKAGGTCKVAAVPPAAVTTPLRTDVVLAMLSGFQPNRVLDRIVRSRMAKLQGAYVGARLKAAARFTMKLDPVKFQKALDKARKTFIDSATKLLLKATAIASYQWTGPPPQLMAGAIEDVTNSFADSLD